jgi:hypothetical protein
VNPEHRPVEWADWKPVTDVLADVARRFAKTQAGRTGRATNDVLIDAEELLAGANAAAGALRTAAISDLEFAERAGLLKVERNLRDNQLLGRVRFFPAKATELHALIGLLTPAEQRRRFAVLFEEAAAAVVPDSHQEGWQKFCHQMAATARDGGSVQPFDRNDPGETSTLLEVLSRLLAWHGESYLRFASCVLCGDSKSLEKWSGRLGLALSRISGGRLCALEDLGITENPRSVMLHGPLRLRLANGEVNLGLLRGVVRVAAADINVATGIESTAARCVSVENETTLHELAKLAAGDVLIGTSFLGGGTRQLLERLPATMALWHFGDSDPAGFAVLADLRERAARTVTSLHMTWRPARKQIPLTAAEQKTAQRLLDSPWLEAAEKAVLQRQLEADDKGAFEQETLGPPTLGIFPFYETTSPTSR